MTAPTTRWWITVIAGWAFATSALAQPAPASSIDGVYNGSYAADQGPTKFKLTLTHQRNGTLAGVFTFYPPGSSGTTSYTCDVVGRYIQASRRFQLRRSRWETAPPRNVIMIGMNGTFDPDGGQGAGQILGQMLGRASPDFEAVRDATESANLASATAGTKEAEAPATPIAQRGRRQTAAKPATSSPASPAPVPGFTWRTAIWNGV